MLAMKATSFVEWASLGWIGTGGLEVVSAKIWLKLLKKDQNQGNLIIFSQVLHGNGFDLFKVQMHIIVVLKDIWCLGQNVIKVFREQECCSLVLFSTIRSLIPQLKIVLLEKFIFLFGSIQVLFDFFQFLLKEADKVFVATVHLVD